jgi:hypothetical protein
MADNSAQNATDTIATDDLATLNGGASGSVKVQRVKNGFGVDGDLKDVAPAVGLPTAPQQATAGAPAFATIGTTSSSLLAANTARKGAALFNDTNVDVLVDLSGGTAAITRYSLRISRGGYYELPAGSVATGLITGVGVAAGTLTVTASGSGNFCVTELT